MSGDDFTLWTEIKAIRLLVCFIGGAVNSLFGKLLNLASETAILESVRSKWMLVLFYGLEFCQLSNADLRSLDFSFKSRQRALMLL